MSFNQNLIERNPEATIYVGSIDTKVTPDVIWELFSQCGIVVNVHLPKEKIQSEHQGYGFVEFKSEEDADYAIKIMHMVKLYGKPIKVNKASQDKKTQEVGANLFIGNLDTEVDEKALYDTFSAFGLILSTRISRDPETGASKGFGFISYDNFESSDAAKAAMNGQYFYNKVIQVEYAFKKDSKGERHGSLAERYLASNRPVQQKAAFQQMQPQQLQQQYASNQTRPQAAQTLHMPDQMIPNIQMPAPPQQQIPMNLPPAPQPPGMMSNMSNLPPLPNGPPGGFPLPPLPHLHSNMPPQQPMGQMPMGVPMPPAYMNMGMPPNFPPPPVMRQQNNIQPPSLQ